ncbi:MAG: HAD family phosphatase [Deltaproteobacteria bacterium]|nr:MAG: HAD family phosphatase [Deltaproteobacteria bacterium]
MAKEPLRLAIFDIDGTLRRVRDPWIHLHRHLGVAEQAKELPVRWKSGAISYEEWAQLDAAFWRGSSRTRIVEALDTNPLRDGARRLVGWFTSRSIPCMGISSGLSIFNDITARELRMGKVISNELQFDGDICSGDIFVCVHDDNKVKVMDELLERYGIDAEQVVVFGDGTGDIPLLKKAGLGVAICPANDKVQASAKHAVSEEPIDIAIRFVESHFRVDGNEAGGGY